MNVPECNSLKESYDVCFKEKVTPMLSKNPFDPSIPSMCEDSFLLYKDCVQEVMRKRIEENKKAKK